MDISKEVVLIWALLVLTILAIIIRTVSIKKHRLSSKDTTSNLQLAAPYCSPSSSSSSPTWDVFLSFYGKDTRSNFTSHLYSALDQAGFLTFRDDPALEKGQKISSALLDAIRNSMIFIVVVSENYARSPWCLDELVHILSCNRTEIHVVPVFYYVDPSDVRHQKGSFEKALDGHKKRYSVDMIVKWKSALSEIAELSGYHLRKEANENESNTIQEIVGNVATWTFSTNVSRLEKYLVHKINVVENSLDDVLENSVVGIESTVEEIYQELHMESKIDVLKKSVVGIESTVEEIYQELHMESKIDVLKKSVVGIESTVEETYQELHMESKSKIDVLKKSLVGIGSTVEEIYQELHMESKIDVLKKSVVGIESSVEETYQELHMESKSKIDVLKKSLVGKVDVLEKSLDGIESSVEEIFKKLSMESDDDESDDDESDDDFSFF